MQDDNVIKEISIKPSRDVTLFLVHNEHVKKVVRLSLELMMFTFNFTFTTAKMSTLMRTIQTSLRSTTILVAFLAAFSVVFSTQSSAQDFKMGLSISPNTAWMVSTDYVHEADGAKVNFGFEFMADVLFTENYALGLGVNVFNTGGDVEYYSSEDPEVKVERTYSLQYVELPLTFKMRTNEIGYTTVFGRFGLGIGMNIKAEADEALDSAGREPINADEDINLFRASMIVGGGIERTISGTTALVVGLNYNTSFTNTYKDVELINLGIKSDMRGHDSFISLSLGILF